MTSTMILRCVTAALALAALGAIAPPSSAEARAAGSSFAGTFDWNAGTYQVETWAVTISDGGHIAGSLVLSYTYTSGSLSGRVRADGSYSFTKSVTAPTFDDPERPRNGGPRPYTERTDFTGLMAPDADGNLGGTPGTGASFTWLRQ